MAVTPLELARVAAIAAADKKAEDLVLIDLTEASDVCDYFLVASANNARQVDAVVDEIEERVLKNCAEKVLSQEGKAEGNWVLLDYGAVVCHIFTPETRDYYRIESLWGDAPRVELSN